MARKRHGKRMVSSPKDLRGAWTKTPEGRKRLSDIAKQRIANGKGIGTNGSNAAEIPDEHTAYLYGKCETIIEVYARGKCISFPVVAAKVASILLGEAQRQMVGAFAHMPRMRDNAAE